MKLCGHETKIFTAFDGERNIYAGRAYISATNTSIILRKGKTKSVAKRRSKALLNEINNKIEYVRRVYGIKLKLSKTGCLALPKGSDNQSPYLYGRKARA